MPCLAKIGIHQLHDNVEISELLEARLGRKHIEQADNLKEIRLDWPATSSRSCDSRGSLA